MILIKNLSSPVGRGRRTHQLRLNRGGKPLPPNECPAYDTEQSNAEATVMLKLWGMRSTYSLPSLLGPLWPRVVAPDRVLSIGQIEQFDTSF